jgi:hypothetical protein
MSEPYKKSTPEIEKIKVKILSEIESKLICINPI